LFSRTVASLLPFNANLLYSKVLYTSQDSTVNVYRTAAKKVKNFTIKMYCNLVYIYSINIASTTGSKARDNWTNKPN